MDPPRPQNQPPRFRLPLFNMLAPHVMYIPHSHRIINTQLGVAYQLLPSVLGEPSIGYDNFLQNHMFQVTPLRDAAETARDFQDIYESLEHGLLQDTLTPAELQLYHQYHGIPPPIPTFPGHSVPLRNGIGEDGLPFTDARVFPGPHAEAIDHDNNWNQNAHHERLHSGAPPALRAFQAIGDYNTLTIQWPELCRDSHGRPGLATPPVGSADYRLLLAHVTDFFGNPAYAESGTVLCFIADTVRGLELAGPQTPPTIDEPAPVLPAGATSAQRVPRLPGYWYERSVPTGSVPLPARWNTRNPPASSPGPSSVRPRRSGSLMPSSLRASINVADLPPQQSASGSARKGQTAAATRPTTSVFQSGSNGRFNESADPEPHGSRRPRLSNQQDRSARQNLPTTSKGESSNEVSRQAKSKAENRPAVVTSPSGSGMMGDKSTKGTDLPANWYEPKWERLLHRCIDEIVASGGDPSVYNHQSFPPAASNDSLSYADKGKGRADPAADSPKGSDIRHVKDKVEKDDKAKTVAAETPSKSKTVSAGVAGPSEPLTEDSDGSESEGSINTDDVSISECNLPLTPDSE